MTEQLEQLEQLEQAISANRAEFNRTAEQIRNNPHLSDEGKLASIKQQYERAQQKHQALRTKHEQLKERQREDLHGDLFRPEALGMVESINSRAERGERYRRALMEADSLLEVRDDEDGLRVDDGRLLRYLETAQLAGDTLAEKAAFTIASNRGARTVVDRYLEAHPDQREHYEQYMEVEQETREPSPGQLLGQAFELAAPVRPPELRDSQDQGRSEMQHIFRGGGENG